MKKEFKKKLSLNKQKISSLESSEMKDLKAGNDVQAPYAALTDQWFCKLEPSACCSVYHACSNWSCY